MRLQFFIALLIAVVGAMSYWYVTTAHICPAPLAYRIGALDSHFAITEAEAIERLRTAERVWEEAVGGELFVYDAKADFTINFVFDDRQARADSESVLSADLDAKRAENEVLIETINELQADYEALLQSYNERVAAYESRLATYNQTVRQYNDQGGAPQAVYEELQAEQRALDSEASSLQLRSDELNDLASQLNRLQEESNDRITLYNQAVQRFNRQFGYRREFTQGDYQGDRINIYKFSSAAELITVLTHELGHALGIGHVEDDRSLMYYLLIDESETPSLSDEDIAAFIQTCGTGDDPAHTLRRIIRNAVALIT